MQNFPISEKFQVGFYAKLLILLYLKNFEDRNYFPIIILKSAKGS